MRTPKRALFGLALGLILYCGLRAAVFSGPSRSSSPAPLWWEIVLELKTKGEYRLERPAGGGFSGNYTYSVRWIGCMEVDEQDYLLYPLDSELRQWEAQETAASPETPAFLTTDDFSAKPSFTLKYILRRGRDLYLDFVADGMVFPQNDPEGGVPLLFPSSEENNQQGDELAYNAWVTGGSNRVSLQEAEIYSGPFQKSYAWSWKHQGWQLKQQETVFTVQSHRVEVLLRIIPHFAPPKRN